VCRLPCFGNVLAEKLIFAGIALTFAHSLAGFSHMVWTSDQQVVTCVTDPRCIAPEHYVPPHNASSALFSESTGEQLVPDDELGSIEIWRLFGVDYWGSRPASVSTATHYWGMKGDEEWSFNPLGQEWGIT
jgi:hypothetical protein